MSDRILPRRGLWLTVAVAAYGLFFAACAEEIKTQNIGPQLFADGKYGEAKEFYEGRLATYFPKADSGVKPPKFTIEDVDEANYYLGRIAFVQYEYPVTVSRLLLVINSMLQREDHDKAMMTETHLIKAQAHGLLAQMGRAVPVNISLAEGHFKSALNGDPSNLPARQGLVIFHMLVPSGFGGNKSLAKQYSKELMELNEAEGYASQGFIELQEKKYAAAEASLLKSIELGTDSAQARVTLAGVYEGWGKSDQAVAELDKAVEMEPGFPPAISAREDLDKAIAKAEAIAAGNAKADEPRRKGSLKSFLAPPSDGASDAASEPATEDTTPAE